MPGSKQKARSSDPIGLIMRLRITFAKTDAMRYTSHLDLQRTWERTLRRARLPLVYSQGFNPHPKINLASALPLGFTSQAEIIEIWLQEENPLGAIETALTPALPPGLQIQEIIETDPRSPKAQNLILSSSYTAKLLNPIPDLGERVETLLRQAELVRERRNKQYNLRPLIEELSVSGADQLSMRLRALPGATGRPDEVLSALSINPHEARVHRTGFIFKRE